MTNSRILLIEDEPGLVLTLTDLLEAEGHAVETANEGNAGFAKAADELFDVVILDVMLPGKSGFEVCRDLRRRGSDVAVLMLTARTQVIDRVVGLKLGADDYLTKPFDPSELLARVEALLRRSRKESPQAVLRCRFGNAEIDFEKCEASKDGKPVNLAGKEMQLLRYLVEHSGKVMSRDELLREVWQYQGDVSTRTVDVHVAWLRQKLEEAPQAPRHILTVRGSGYRFAP